MLNVYYCGYGGGSPYAEALRPLIDELGLKLITIHEWDTADIRWNLNTWKDELKKADIVICPTDFVKFPAKSQNKLTQAMSMGKPVICTSLDAYKAVEEKFPGCCLFADTPEEWKEQLKKLRDDSNLRAEIIRKGLQAAQDYHIDRMGEKWIKVLMNLDKVDIVIPTYKNLRGIRHCLESIRKCTNVRYHLIVVNNGSSEELHKYLEQQGDITYIKKPPPLNFAQAVNEGIKAGNGKYVMVLNDDVIVSKGWLRQMIETCKEDVGAVGPLSNCDRGWYHSYSLNIGGVELLPGKNTFEEIEPIIPQIYDFKSPYQEQPDREWIAFYCTLIRRDVLDKTGLLNEEFVNSGEDVDFCYRIKKQGFRIVQDYRAFVFHQGAVSRKMLEQENPENYHEADKRTNAHLSYLWNKKSVMIYSGPSWERWSFKSLDEGGIGGSETWVIWLSRELSRLGYRVTVFADTVEQEMCDEEVQWLHYTQYPGWVEQHWTDYAILSRTTDPLRFSLRAGKIYVQIHDLWLLSDRQQTFLDKVHKYAALSDWHSKFASDYHGIPQERMVKMANGIALDRYSNLGIERNPHRLFWSSSLDRGLDTLIYLFGFIKREIPDLELHVFYGVENWKKSALSKNDKEALKRIDEYMELMKQPGIFYHGRIGQKQLAVEQMKSSLWAFSTDFEESFCITAIEAQAAGVPVIASNYAGLQTTVGDSGILIGNGKKGQPYTKEYREDFVTHCIDILKNKDKWQEWSEKGKENAKKYSWENCALRWRNLFEG
jgi:GT2 family glycosyltransferase